MQCLLAYRAAQQYGCGRSDLWDTCMCPFARQQYARSLSRLAINLLRLQSHYILHISLYLVAFRIYAYVIMLTTFLPRDAMRKRGTSCQPVSVCLSVCHVRSCIISKQLKDILKPFLCLVPQSNPIITVFEPKRHYSIRKEPFSGSDKNKGVRKFSHFD